MPRNPPRPAARAALRAAVLSALALGAHAQSTGYGMQYGAADDPSRGYTIQNNQTMPFRGVYGGGRRTPYNIMIGPASARFSAALNLTYNDNLLLTGTGVGSVAGSTDDFIVQPMLLTALEWRFSDLNGVRLDIGLGYQKHVNFTALDTLIVSPNSTIDWHAILGDVRISLFNQTSTPSELDQRPELVGGTSPTAIAFRRIQNMTGLSAGWQPLADLSVQAGYTYMIERGLLDGFGQLDRDQNGANLAVYERLSPRWTVGVSGSYFQSSFSSGFQNNANSYAGGFLAAWHPSRNLNVSGNLRYNVTEFGQSGRVADTSAFSGLNYDFTVTHRFHRDWNYQLVLNQGVNTGFGSNFTEQFNALFNVAWNGIDNLGISASANFVSARESGSVITVPREFRRIGPGQFNPSIPGMVDEGGGNLFYFPPGVVDRGDGFVDIPLPGQRTEIMQFGINFTRSFGKKLSGALSYTRAVRTSDLELRDFAQNIVIMSLNYTF